MIKNLSQLKKALVKGVEFDIVEHCRFECVGERRKVNYANTTGFYSVIPSDPDCKISKANGGKGSFLSWSNAPFWGFREDGVCAIYSSDKNQVSDTCILAFKLINPNGGTL